MGAAVLTVSMGMEDIVRFFLVTTLQDINPVAMKIVLTKLFIVDTKFIMDNLIMDNLLRS